MTEKQTEKSLVPARKEVNLVGGIAPQDFADLHRFADLVAKSHLAPQSFDSPEKIAVGILTNMELGRPIITGLQDLAIINGKCGIYGDASLAMVTASGLMEEGYPIEEETGEPYTPEWTFIFKVKRKGGPERVGKWTWADSIRAGFDSPKRRDGGPDKFSPWTRFPRRMMQWKARNYVLRDTFGDILKGMKTIEDLHDMDAVPLTQGADGTYASTATTQDLTSSLKRSAPKDTEKEKVETPPEETAADQENESENGFISDDDRNGDIDKVYTFGMNDQDETLPEHDWHIGNWKNMRTGNGTTTGFAAFISQNMGTFHEAPDEIKKLAKSKYQSLYNSTWPGDVPPGPGLATTEEEPEKTPDGEENPFHGGDPAADTPVKETKNAETKKWSNKEELEAEAAALAKQNVVNLNAIRKFSTEIRKAAYDNAGLKPPVLLSTEKFEKVQEVLDRCQKIAAGEDDNGAGGEPDPVVEELVENIKEFDIEAREPAFKKLGVPLSANLAVYGVERLTDLFNRCVEEAKKLMM